MTTDSFPLRLDTSTGVIKFIETDSDDLLVIAAKVGEYIAAKYDSSSRGRFELKTGTGDAGYIGTIVDTDWENSTNGAAVDSTGIEVINNHYLGLIETGNVNQKTDAIEPLAYPLRWDRTLGGLQEIGDSGGSDPALSNALDTIIRLIFAHDLPGVYQMVPMTVLSSATDGTITLLDGGIGGLTNPAANTLRGQGFLDSDEWELQSLIPQGFRGTDDTYHGNESVRIYQKVGLTDSSATWDLVRSKQRGGRSPQLIKRRFLEIAGQELFLGVGAMGGNADGVTPSREMQEFFGGALLNRLYENNQGTGYGKFTITTSATPPAGYRNIGKYEDLKKSIQYGDGIDAATTYLGPNSSRGGIYARQVLSQSVARSRRRQGQANFGGWPQSTFFQNQRSQGAFRAQTRFSGQYSPSVSGVANIITTYYLHVKI